MSKRIGALLCALLFLGVLLFLPLAESRTDAEVSAYPSMGFTVVLDAGHGGEDGGAIGIRTLAREKDINLSIVKKLARLFESVGADVVLTRSDENALCRGKYSKAEDMRARAAIVEAAKPYFVISVHCNSFPQSKSVCGAQMFYFPGSVTGERLADDIQEALRAYVDPENTRSAKAENFFMLRHGNSTNVMVECGFLSSPEEEALLCDETYQDHLAYAVFAGTCAYYSRIGLPQNY